MRRFDIGSVAGAKVTGKGQILNGANGPTGDVGLQVNAAEPSGLLQFIGVGQGGNPPLWTRELGTTDLDVTLEVREGANEPTLKLNANGTSGPFTLGISGVVQKFSQRRFAELSFNSSIEAADGSRLLTLFGIPVVQEHTGSGHFEVSGIGSFGGGVKLKAAASAVSTRTEFTGEMFVQSDEGFRLVGNAMFATKNPEFAVRALGIPVFNSIVLPVSLKANINASSAGVDLADISGDFGGQALQGTIRIGTGRRVSANIDVAHASLPDIAAMIMMGWRNRPTSFDEPFASELPFGMTGEVWLRPKTLSMWRGEDAREAVIGVLSEPGTRRMSVAGRSSNNETLTVEVGIKPVSGQFEVDISGIAPMSVARVFTDKDGSTQLEGDASIEVQVKGTGLTPYAVLADLSGKGRLQATGLRFSKIAPQHFTAALPKVVTADDLTKAISLLESGGGLELGNFTSDVKVSSGAGSIVPVTREFGTSQLVINAGADLAAGTITVSNQITFDVQSGLPQAAVVLGGPIGAVTVRSLTSEVASKLGYEILARDLAELERVQKQQAEIIAKEEKQRVNDEAKFQAYQEQKAELRLRIRETKIHGVQRVKVAAIAKAALDALLANEPKATANEFAQRKREMKILSAAAVAPSSPIDQQNGLQIPNSFNLDRFAPSPQ